MVGDIIKLKATCLKFFLLIFMRQNLKKTMYFYMLDRSCLNLYLKWFKLYIKKDTKISLLVNNLNTVGITSKLFNKSNPKYPTSYRIKAIATQF